MPTRQLRKAVFGLVPRTKLPRKPGRNTDGQVEGTDREQNNRTPEERGNGERHERPNGQTAGPDGHPKSQDRKASFPATHEGSFQTFCCVALGPGLLPQVKDNVARLRVFVWMAQCGSWPDRFRLDGPVWLWPERGARGLMQLRTAKK